MAVAYGSLPFKEQIAFFRAKKDVLTDSYLDVWETQHDVAFMVAGANRADLLADLRTAVDKAISTGSTLPAAFSASCAAAGSGGSSSAREHRLAAAAPSRPRSPPVRLPLSRPAPASKK